MMGILLKNTVCLSKFITHQPLARFGVEVAFARSVSPVSLASVVPYKYSLTFGRSSVSKIKSKGSFLLKHNTDTGNIPI